MQSHSRTHESSARSYFAFWWTAKFEQIIKENSKTENFLSLLRADRFVSNNLSFLYRSAVFFFSSEYNFFFFSSFISLRIFFISQTDANNHRSSLSIRCFFFKYRKNPPVAEKNSSRNSRSNNLCVNGNRIVNIDSFVSFDKTIFSLDLLLVERKWCECGLWIEIFENIICTRAMFC